MKSHFIAAAFALLALASAGCVTTDETGRTVLGVPRRQPDQIIDMPLAPKLAKVKIVCGQQAKRRCVFGYSGQKFQ